MWQTGFIYLILGWAAYYTVHSVLAAKKVKDLSGLPARTYRRLYVLISVAGLFILLVANGRLGGEYLLPRTGVTRYLSLFITAAGVLVGREAFRVNSLQAFLGISDDPDQTLVTKGIYGWVRHPLYSATLLITAGFFLFDSRMATLISVACTWLYLVPGIYFEENRLIAQYGTRYTEYRKRVKAVIPFIL